ncbi:hypothetical protein [Urechidicola croceus]|uniref:Uncharacterized protein n=1 Tax=Urechidicola croceus TaxID=1850246 RepID=A0A1D8P8B0_9FLAO|nr:hypothetical protein [Urechidicola croceus]AOW20771.1 hypothetical protein LPB138_08815 [Urechidicola croceus]
MRYIIILILLVGCSTKVDKKNNETKEPLINQVSFQEENKAPIVLEELSLLNGKLAVNLPNNFGLMNEKMLATKYPSNNRPTLVYTNAEGTINFAFNHTTNPVPKDKISDLLPPFVNQFNSVYPQIEWFKKDLEIVNDKNFIVLEFIVPAIDTKIYNLMYITELDGKMFMSTFNCIESIKNEWEIIAKKSLNSIKITE